MFSMFISASLYTLSDSEVKVDTAQAVGGRNLYGVKGYRPAGKLRGAVLAKSLEEKAIPH
jgi:hypothetical protein